jgi:HSP90 family molecular chaperone
LKSSGKAARKLKKIIGHFGLGFYSDFMCPDKVLINTYP